MSFVLATQEGMIYGYAIARPCSRPSIWCGIPIRRCNRSFTRIRSKGSYLAICSKQIRTCRSRQDRWIRLNEIRATWEIESSCSKTCRMCQHSRTTRPRADTLVRLRDHRILTIALTRHQHALLSIRCDLIHTRTEHHLTCFKISPRRRVDVTVGAIIRKCPSIGQSCRCARKVWIGYTKHSSVLFQYFRHGNCIRLLKLNNIHLCDRESDLIAQGRQNLLLT